MSQQKDIIEIARNVLRTEADAVAALIERLDRNFEDAVELIYRSTGRVVVTGMGKSGLVGKKIAATLASTGTPAFFLHPAEASHGDLGMVTSDDVIIAISNSGETEELVSILPFLKRFGVRLVALTGNRDSTLARRADVHLNVAVAVEACPFGIVPTASTTAALAMGDALAVALLSRRGFKEEDFASFHPSGSLGKRLLVRVRDVMHSGNDMPVVAPGTPMMNTVVEISSKRLGIAVIAAEDRRVLGVITDGDVRRGIQKWGKQFFDLAAEEAMTKSPKMIDADELAAAAVAVMEKNAITVLLVTDQEGRIEGLVHLHDVLKRGVV